MNIIILSFQSFVNTTHTFKIEHNTFKLNNRPFQIIAGEMHPQRIPKEHWRNRVQLAKNLGINTISMYFFWNQVEKTKGDFNFNETNDIANFLQICQENELFVLLRPGPYTCGDVDFGGLPHYLLKQNNIRIRTDENIYFRHAYEEYITKLSSKISSFMVGIKGGNILMIQLDNEYDSWPVFRRSMEYLPDIKHLFEANLNQNDYQNITISFYTADKDTILKKNQTVYNSSNVAIGIDDMINISEYINMQRNNPNKTLFISSVFSGWLGHFGDSKYYSQTKNTSSYIYDYVNHKDLHGNNISFNIYMLHGGTNFGTLAGANLNNNKYVSDLTSYDYGALISEDGKITQNYKNIQKILKPAKLQSIQHVKNIKIPQIKLNAVTTLDKLNNTRQVKTTKPYFFEYFDQNQGFILYQFMLPKGEFDCYHQQLDYHQVYLSNNTKGSKLIILNSTHFNVLLKNDTQINIFVEGMGHVGYKQIMEFDRKGIYKHFKCQQIQNNSVEVQVIQNWTHTLYNIDDIWSNVNNNKFSQLNDTNKVAQVLFNGSFNITKLGDTFLDMNGFGRGFVWVNGNNLGRFNSVGPQYQLYLPSSFLHKEINIILILDLELTNISQKYLQTMTTTQYNKDQTWYYIGSVISIIVVIIIFITCIYFQLKHDKKINHFKIQRQLE